MAAPGGGVFSGEIVESPSRDRNVIAEPRQPFGRRMSPHGERIVCGDENYFSKKINDGTGFCTLEFISEALGVSSKKLQRLLAQEDTAFSEIYNRVRRDIACRILAETEVTLDKIAGLLDYTSAAAFANAFRRWHGISPRAFRKRARDAASHAIISVPGWWRAVNNPIQRELQRRR